MAREHEARGEEARGEEASGRGGPSGEEARGELQQDAQHRICLAVPKPVLAAFDETIELYRAVEGHESTVSSFVESLVADAMAGECPPDAEEIPVIRGPGQEQIESALERSTDGWIHLPAPPSEASALQAAGESLRRVEAVARHAGSGGPGEIDAQLQELVALENSIDRRLGKLLAEMARHRAWIRLRFAGTGHYAEERLGMARTAAGDRVRAERALRTLPLVRSAYEIGRIGLEAALLVARTLADAPAGCATQQQWIRRASESTIKRLRDEARALRRDDIDLPPLPLGDSEWHRSLRREPGTARRRVNRFGMAALGLSLAGEGGFDLSQVVTSSLEPDVFLRVRLPRDLATAFLGAINSARLQLTNEADDLAAQREPRPSLLAAQILSTRCRRIPAWVGLLALLEEFAETWDTYDPSRRLSRDSIYSRDGWRCAAPGCTSRRNLEDHHLEYRSRGGSDAPSNRLCLCRFHHQMGEHGGLASCTGKAPLGVVWSLGREPLASWFRNERRIEVTA